MRDQDKTKEQLIDELAELRQQVAELEASEAERERVEEALWESEEHYRFMAESIDLGIILIDCDHNIVMVNAAVAKRLKKSPREIIGKKCFREFEKRDAVCPHCPGVQAIATGWPAEVETESIGDDRGRFMVRAFPAFRQDGTLRGFIEIAQDITERKQTEEALRESEERYRSFVQNFQGIAFRGRMDFTPIFFHGAVEKITGYTEKEFLDGKPRWDQVIHQEDLSVLLTEDEERLHSIPHHSYEREYRIVRKDGAVRWVHEIIQNICDDSWRPVLVHGAIYDITERKQSEEEIRRRVFEQRALREAVLALTTTLDHDEVIDRILARLQEVVPYDTASVQLLREGDLEIVGGRGFPNLEELLGVTFDPNQEDNPNREVVRIQAPFIVDDAPTVYNEFLRDPHAPAGIRSWLGVPMLMGDQMLGMIALDKREPGFYTQEHAQLAEAFAAQAAIAIKNAQLFEQARQEINERQQAEAALREQTRALRESEEQLRTTLASMDELVFVLDKDGIFRDHYYPPGRSGLYSPPEMLLGKSFKDVMPPHVVELVDTAINAVITSGTVQTFDYHLEMPEGTKWYSANISMQKDTSGDFAGITAVSRDITERKQAEELIRIQRDLGMTLSTAPGLEETLRLCTEAAIRVSGMDCGGIYLIDETSGSVDLAFHQGLPAHFVENASHYDADSVNARLVMEGMPFYTRHHELDEPLDEHVHREGLRALAVIPVHYEDRVIACLNVASHTLNEVPLSAHTPLETIATQIGSAIAHSKAQKALQQSQTNLQTLFDSLKDFLFVLDNKGRILGVNPVVVQRLGYSEDELLGESVLKVPPPDRHEEAAAIVADMIAGKTDVCAVPVMAKDGTQIPVETRIVHGRWDDQEALFGISRDITERLQAEEEREQLLAQIRGQAQRMQYILDTVPEGVLLLDTDEQLILVNPVAERELVVLSDARTGDTLTHLGNRPLVELLTSPPQGLWHEVTANGRSFQVIARPIENGPTPIGWVMVIRDVTQQREIEQRIQQQERLAAVGQLAAGIAHDFNNIMATIVLYAQMTARMEELPAVVRERMETINQQAGHATKLILQILDFSRRAVLERRPLDIVHLLKEHVKLLERTLPESIEIELVYEPDESAAPLTVHADPTRMQQMVTNLAVNARDAMPNGGTLRIRLERIEVKPGESSLLPEMEPGDWAQVTMSDTGTGIPPDVLPHIFEPFFTTRAPLGSGLGLAQVHGIVGQHGGRINVDTQVGKGTTFTIYLPALPVHSPKPSGVSALRELATLPTGQGETVLVVEDDAIVLEALVESLELLNYQVLGAKNGREALAVLEQSSGEIDLLLSDVVMPEMGGKALLYALRERGLTIPVVMLTGHPLKKEMEELRAQGMADWLPKPPELEDLAEVVARALGTD